jgi:undecaprenyl-diphosphatase
MGLSTVIILAIVQALTEFIPVSSTGHLIIADRVGGLDNSLALDVILHMGTLLALIIYYRQKLREIVVDLIHRRSSRLLMLIVISSVPAVTVALLFEDLIGNELRAVEVVAFMLVALGLVMIFEKAIFGRQPHRSLGTLRWSDAVIVGLGQSLALVPGTSRSGASILSGRLVGLSNRDSTDYAFLIGIPVILGAGLKTLLDSHAQEAIADQPGQVLLGLAIATTVGWLAIDIVIRVVKKSGLKWFGLYRVALASVLLTLMLTS